MERPAIPDDKFAHILSRIHLVWQGVSSKVLCWDSPKGGSSRAGGHLPPDQSTGRNRTEECKRLQSTVKNFSSSAKYEHGNETRPILNGRIILSGSFCVVTSTGYVRGAHLHELLRLLLAEGARSGQQPSPTCSDLLHSASLVKVTINAQHHPRTNAALFCISSSSTQCGLRRTGVQAATTLRRAYFDHCRKYLYSGSRQKTRSQSMQKSHI